MVEDDFLKLVKSCNFNEDYNQYLQNHNIEDVLNLINKRASWVEIDNVEYIVDNNQNIQIPIERLCTLLSNRKYFLTDKTPNYIFSNSDYVDELAKIYPYGYNRKLLLEKSFELGGLTLNNFQIMLEKGTFKSTDLPDAILVDAEYAKVLILTHLSYFDYIHDGGLTHENIDLAFEKGYSYSKYSNVKARTNSYFCKKVFETRNGYATDLILEQLKNNQKFFSVSEITEMITDKYQRENYFDKRWIDIIAYYPNSIIELINIIPSNCIELIDKLPSEILENEKNGVVLKAIDKGYRISEISNLAIKKNLTYLKYIIDNSENFHSIKQVIEFCDESLLLDETNGLVLTAIDKGYPIYLLPPNSLITKNSTYMKHFLSQEKVVPQTVINACDDSLIEDETNGIVLDAIDKGLRFSLGLNPIIRTKLSYIKAFLSKETPVNFNVILNNCAPELILDDSNDLVIDAIDSGYKLRYDTNHLIISNVKYMQYYFEHTTDYDAQIALNYIDDSIFNDEENGIVFKALDKGYKINAKTSLIIRANLSYLEYAYNKDKEKKDIFSLIVINEENINDFRIAQFMEMFLNNGAYLIKYGIDKTIDSYFLQEDNPYDFMYKALEKGYKIDNNSNILITGNENYIKFAITHNQPNAINYLTCSLTYELFELAIQNGLSMYAISDTLKGHILSNDTFFNTTINKIDDANKLAPLLELFYPLDNLDINRQNKLEQLLNVIANKIHVIDSERLKNNLAYLYGKNKELFCNLNIEILRDELSFLGIETINRIVADPDMQSMIIKTLKDNNYKNKLKLFKLTITYLYNLDTEFIKININDILYNIINNGINSYDFSKLFNDEWKNIDRLISEIEDGNLKGKRLGKIENLIMLLYSGINKYKINKHSQLDSQVLFEKKQDYFNNLKLDNMQLDQVKESIFLKFYNMSLKRATFLYNRYCFNMHDLNNIKNSTLIQILKNINLIINCEDIDLLKEIYKEVPFSKIHFEDVVLLEGIIRNEYISGYNDALYKLPLGKEKIKKFNVANNIDIYELDKDVSMLVHVLGGYSKYVEPDNFKTEWNIQLMRNHGICTSYLTDQNLSTAKLKFPILAFTEIENNSILLSEPTDIGSSRSNERYATTFTKSCRFLFPKAQIDYTRWHHNEIVLERKKLDAKDGEEYKRQPNYIVYIAEGKDILENNELNIEHIEKTDLWRMSLKAANDFGVPILIVNRAKVSKKEHKELDDMISKLDSSKNWLLLNKIIVRYMNNLMGNNPYFEAKELDKLIDKYLSIASFYKEQGDYQKSLDIIDILLYSVKNEDRKFSGSFVDSEYNYLSKFSDSITNIYNELHSLMNVEYQEGNKKI